MARQLTPATLDVTDQPTSKQLSEIANGRMGPPPPLPSPRLPPSASVTISNPRHDAVRADKTTRTIRDLCRAPRSELARAQLPNPALQKSHAALSDASTHASLQGGGGAVDDMRLPLPPPRAGTPRGVARFPGDLGSVRGGSRAFPPSEDLAVADATGGGVARAQAPFRRGSPRATNSAARPAPLTARSGFEELGAMRVAQRPYPPFVPATHSPRATDGAVAWDSAAAAAAASGASGAAVAAPPHSTTSASPAAADGEGRQPFPVAFVSDDLPRPNTIDRPCAPAIDPIPSVAATHAFGPPAPRAAAVDCASALLINLRRALASLQQGDAR